MAKNFETPPTDKLLRLDDVLEVVGVGRSTLYRMISEGTFPGGQKISKRCVGWRHSIVRQWMSRNTAGGVYPGLYVKTHTSHAVT